MNFDLKKPCSNCPFRTDTQPYISEARAKQIAHGLIEKDAAFVCHKTLHRDGFKGPQQHCAGALIILDNMKMPNQMMRIAFRLRQFKPSELDKSSPVFKNLRAFIERHKDRS